MTKRESIQAFKLWKTLYLTYQRAVASKKDFLSRKTIKGLKILETDILNYPDLNLFCKRC